MAGEIAGIFGQLRPIGGQRELVERAGREMARERGDERHDPAAHQRFAAGKPQLSDPACDERAAHPVELFEREQIGLRQEGHVFRHAIDAAKVATIGHRDAQIGDRPPERVDQRGKRCFAIEGEILRDVRHYGPGAARRPAHRG